MRLARLTVPLLILATLPVGAQPSVIKSLVDPTGQSCSATASPIIVYQTDPVLSHCWCPAGTSVYVCQSGGGGGVDEFVLLTDTPPNYYLADGKCLVARETIPGDLGAEGQVQFEGCAPNDPTFQVLRTDGFGNMVSSRTLRYTDNKVFIEDPNPADPAFSIEDDSGNEVFRVDVDDAASQYRVSVEDVDEDPNFLVQQRNPSTSGDRTASMILSRNFARMGVIQGIQPDGWSQGGHLDFYTTPQGSGSQSRALRIQDDQKIVVDSLAGCQTQESPQGVVSADPNGVLTCVPDSDTGGGGGEANDGANLGTGQGQVYRQKTGVTLEFRSIRGQVGSGMTVSQGMNQIDVAVTDPAVDFSYHPGPTKSTQLNANTSIDADGDGNPETFWVGDWDGDGRLEAQDLQQAVDSCPAGIGCELRILPGLYRTYGSCDTGGGDCTLGAQAQCPTGELCCATGNCSYVHPEGNTAGAVEISRSDVTLTCEAGAVIRGPTYDQSLTANNNSAALNTIFAGTKTPHEKIENVRVIGCGIHGGFCLDGDNIAGDPDGDGTSCPAGGYDQSLIPGASRMGINFERCHWCRMEGNNVERTAHAGLYSMSAENLVVTRNLLYRVGNYPRQSGTSGYNCYYAFASYDDSRTIRVTDNVCDGAGDAAWNTRKEGLCAGEDTRCNLDSECGANGPCEPLENRGVAFINNFARDAQSCLTITGVEDFVAEGLYCYDMVGAGVMAFSDTPTPEFWGCGNQNCIAASNGVSLSDVVIQRTGTEGIDIQTYDSSITLSNVQVEDAGGTGIRFAYPLRNVSVRSATVLRSGVEGFRASGAIDATKEQGLQIDGLEVFGADYADKTDTTQRYAVNINDDVNGVSWSNIKVRGGSHNSLRFGGALRDSVLTNVYLDRLETLYYPRGTWAAIGGDCPGVGNVLEGYHTIIDDAICDGTGTGPTQCRCTTGGWASWNGSAITFRGNLSLGTVENVVINNLTLVNPYDGPALFIPSSATLGRFTVTNLTAYETEANEVRPGNSAIRIMAGSADDAGLTAVSVDCRGLTYGVPQGQPCIWQTDDITTKGLHIGARGRPSYLPAEDETVIWWKQPDANAPIISSFVGDSTAYTFKVSARGELDYNSGYTLRSLGTGLWGHVGQSVEFRLGSLGLGGSTVKIDTAGSAPAGACSPNGSIRMVTAGDATGGLYVCEQGNWAGPK